MPPQPSGTQSGFRQVTRVNSVAVSTANFAAVGKRLLQDDFAAMLVDTGLGPDDIFGIQYLPHRQIVVVKFYRKDEYEKFLGLDSVTVTGITCRIYDLSSQHTKVTIMGAPFEMEKEDIVELLTSFGEVKQIRQRLLSCEKNKNFNSLPDGTWLATMRIKTNIPSYLLIHDTTLFISYFGQPKTCRICDATGHIAKDCNTRTKTNIVQKTSFDFPTLAEANQRTRQPINDDHDTLLVLQEKPSTLTTESQPPEVEQQVHGESTSDDGQHLASSTIDMEPPPTNQVPHKTRRSLLQSMSPSTSAQEPSIKLRPIKKRRKTPNKIKTPEKMQENPHDSPLNFVDLDQNYIISFQSPCQSDADM